MKARELRSAFTTFFEKRGHEVVPSASLIPHDDTILFTNAGMVPFKNYFLGIENPPYRRATTVQKCVRAGGKHNDLDEVGRTSRHLTFFEMMGNFSFGDYFKEEAIPLAWEFFTDVLQLDPERLWVTVHHTDDEAAHIWEQKVGVPPDRIQRLGEDNWWRMADTGPNGPCSEIFWDKGEKYGPPGGPENPASDERYIEIWNLVFMQYDQQSDGEQIPLPRPSIDTGAGLERVLSVMQNVDAVWELDEFQTLLEVAEAITGVAKDSANSTVVSLQILVDHARSSSFLISDGVIPSNEDRGYVLRRIVRRAVRHAYLLGVEKPIMSELADAVITLMDDAYPDLAENKSLIKESLQREEEGFRRTLSAGMKILEGHLSEVKENESLSGEVAFQLHDTYGFPMELTQEIAAERKIAINLEQFNDAMALQRERGKADLSLKGNSTITDSVLQKAVEKLPATSFRGYIEHETISKVLYLDNDFVVLDKSPFYAEAGGQVGDTGTITNENGTLVIGNTTAMPSGHYLHTIEEINGAIKTGDVVTAMIDSKRRLEIQRHHTGTHLLHWALRTVLGDHVKQQGSWVGPERLRFDFSHFASLTKEEIEQIEDLVNKEIFSGSSVEIVETTMKDAKELGALAFFGDKYGDDVRVLKAGEHSVELCGGTHVHNLSDIGPMKILSEGSIGSNIRRIEAISGTGTIGLIRSQQNLIEEASTNLGVPSSSLIEGVAKKNREIDELMLELDGLRTSVLKNSLGTLLDKAQDGIIAEQIDGVGRNDMRDLIGSLCGSEGIKAVILGVALDSGGVALAAGVPPGSKLDASELIAESTKLIKGGGGKGKDFAMAGGKDSTALEKAIHLARQKAESG
ncbi:MAG: alanine--tRNA ligase [Actinomycetota bacterium]|nr:alanine--tRNA ligase [Actinomycetota bacterium]MEC8118750.1 alanine--tRNA ligase [Actinomycetota bacterium]